MGRKDKGEYNAYMREYMLKRYHARRQQAFDILGRSCRRCGGTEELEFDHIDATNKSFSVGRLWSIKEALFFAEIQKCQVLCKQCHLQKSRECQDGVRGKPAANRVTNYNHGTGYMYNRNGCRCTPCRDWRRQYRNKLVRYDGVTRAANSIG